jgi:hypothetical protein
MKSLSILVLMMLSINGWASSSGNKDVQKAMKSYVNQMTKNKSFMPVIYKGKVLKLSVAKSKKYPDGFHSGVKNKGELYVSCADFVDEKGNKYDIDFLVNKTDDKYAVVQPIVHSINGEKNPYDLDH